MAKAKSVFIYVFLVTALILLFSSFDAQFYFDFSKTANLSGDYMYAIFTDKTAELPKTVNESDAAETKKDNYAIGDSSKYILEYKFILYYLGYLDYPVTGVFDESVTEAVNAYRAANNMTQNGLLDLTMMNLLDGEVLEYRQGMRGEKILYYQQILQALEYIPSGEGLNGSFGELTYYAVTNYQTKHGLSVTGSLDTATMQDLDEDKTRLDNGETAEDINNGENSTETPSTAQ